MGRDIRRIYGIAAIRTGLVVFSDRLWYNQAMDEYGYQGGNNIPPQGYYQRMPQKRTNAMAVASLVMAVMALLTILTGLDPVFFGSMSILFAVLSKGSGRRMNGSAFCSVMISVVSVAAGVILMIKVADMIQNNPGFRSEMDKSFEMMYGVDYDDFVDGMKKYYETGEMPEFMEKMQQGDSPYYTFPGGTQL